jgi:hypothetical protein
VKLDRLEIPAEHEARERAWAVLQAAFAEREPVPRPRRRLVPALAFGILAAAVAAAFTPPGQALVDEVREAIGVEAEEALFELPVGRLLVVADSGAWIVSRDGSKRRLGDYREAAWSPFGRFVVATRENELVALEPDGEVRWKLPRPDVRAPRWTGTRFDTRIAYLSGGTVRVVAGDGTGDHALGPGTSIAWRDGPGHVLEVTRPAGVSVVDADTGRVLSRDAEPAPPRAAVRRTAAGSELLVDGRVRFRGTGTFRDPTLSPDGRWVAISWTDADQLVFVRTSGPLRFRAAANITAQFDSASFPRLGGWAR